MKAPLPSLLFAASLGLVGTADATLVEYTDSARFLAAIKADYYLENFQSLVPNTTPASLAFGSTNGYSYTASATGGTLYVVPVIGGSIALSTSSAHSTLQLDFTGAPVTALGGLFFSTDVFNNPLISRIELAFSDGSTWALTNAALTSFIGFTSSVAITSLDITAPADGCAVTYCFTTLDDFYVGEFAQVPVPATALLLAVGLLGLGSRGGRARRRAT